LTNGKGRLASISSTVSSYTYGGYDAMGQVISATQTIGAQSYPKFQTYDLTGHVKQMTYPSNRTVNYSYDSTGRLNSFTGNLGEDGHANDSHRV
jgi:RHS Repeat